MASCIVDPDDVQHDLVHVDSNTQPPSNHSHHHHHIPASPSSIANSPMPFSFSPVRYSASQDQYCAHYPVSSYETDMTSVIGSWEPGHDQTMAPVREDKGKAVDRQDLRENSHVGEEEPPEPPVSSKGKGKATLTHHASFEFEFEPYDTEPSTHLPNVLSEVFAHSSVMRLSPGPASHHFDHHPDAVYAGPSSRNGGILADIPLEDHAEAAFSEPPSLSSSRPPSSLDHFSASRPIHKRSFSSLSMRSIRSSSSRSLASIRSKLTPKNIKGKVKAIAPKAKKLKGGLRRMFIRESSSRGESSHNPSTSEDETEEEVLQITGNQSVSPPQDNLFQGNNRLSSAHLIEASTISEKTIMPWKMDTELIGPLDETLEIATNGKQRSKSDPAVLTTVMRELDELETELILRDTPDMDEIREKKNYFNNNVPREVQLEILKCLISLHEEEFLAADRNETWNGRVWSATTAGKARWVGHERGMRELVKLSRVSKSWYSLAYDGQLWQSLRLTSLPPHLSPSLLLRIVKHAGSFVRILDLKGWVHLDPPTLRMMVRSLSVEPSLDLSSRSLQPPVSLTTIPFPPTNLTRLTLRTCTSLTSNSLHLVLLRSPHLKNIDFRGLSAVTKSTCGILSACCPQLEVADLGRCAKLDGKGLQELVDGSALSRSWMSEDGSSSIIFPDDTARRRQQNPSVSKLRALKVSGLRGVNEDVMVALAKGAPGLEVLDMSCADDVTDAAIEAFVAWDTAWDLLPPESPFVRQKVELTAREMGRDPTADYGPFYKRVTRLRHLNLSSCPLLTDLACIHLAHCVPRLEFLELGDIGGEMKDAGLVRLLGTIPLIRRVDLEDASDITDAVLSALTPQASAQRDRQNNRDSAAQPGRYLEHLIISNALNVTNVALLALIRACKKLKALECDNTRISGAVAKEFIKLARARHIKGAELVAVDCRGVNETLVKELAAAGETRPRKGFRHFDAHFLGFVDARDEEDLAVGGCEVDDCDETRVTLKSFWSWQAVDMVQQLREKRRKMSSNSRRNTDPGIGVFGFRRFQEDDDDDGFGDGLSTASNTSRWLSQLTRARSFSSTGGGSPTGLNDDDRSCILM